MKRLLLLLIAGCFLTPVGNSTAGNNPQSDKLNPVFEYVSTTNKHDYYISTAKRTWSEAKALCELNGGYLATISSADENALVLTCFKRRGESGYIGLSDKSVEGTFQWVTGEPLGYTNWMSGEPNNQNGTQDVVYMKVSGLPGEDGKWDDGDETNQYYFVLEIEITPVASVTSRDIGAGKFELAQNYPNPFNPSTTIRYSVPDRGQITITVFNTLGQQISTLVDGQTEAGHHEVRWDASAFPSGVYFYRLQAGSFIDTKKLMLLK